MNRSEFEEHVINFLTRNYRGQMDPMRMAISTVELPATQAFIDYCYKNCPHDINNAAEICAEGIYLTVLHNRNPSSVPEYDDGKHSSGFEMMLIVGRQYVIARHESER